MSSQEKSRTHFLSLLQMLKMSDKKSEKEPFPWIGLKNHEDTTVTTMGAAIGLIALILASPLVVAARLKMTKIIPTVNSVRAQDVMRLKHSLLTPVTPIPETFWLVEGRHACVGTSTMVKTALKGQSGVIVKIRPGMTCAQVKQSVFHSVLGKVSFASLAHSMFGKSYMNSMNWWFMRMSDIPPIVVLEMHQVSQDCEFADVKSPAREMSKWFHVLIDACPNSLPPHFVNGRVKLGLQLSFLKRHQIESIEEFEPLITFLRKHHLDDTVWQILGGIPILYTILKEESFVVGEDLQMVDEIKAFLVQKLLTASDALLMANALDKSIIARMKELKILAINDRELDKDNIRFSESSSKLFTEIYDNDGRRMIVPKTAAIGVMIQNEELFSPRQALNKLIEEERNRKQQAVISSDVSSYLKAVK